MYVAGVVCYHGDVCVHILIHSTRVVTQASCSQYRISSDLLVEKLVSISPALLHGKAPKGIFEGTLFCFYIVV